MPSLSQLLIAFIGSVALVVGEEEAQATSVRPTTTGYGYDVTHRNFGQLQSQYGYQPPVTGFRAGSSWPYNQDQYNAYGNKNWNSGQYSTYPTAAPAYGNRFSAFGTTGYQQGYGNQGMAYNTAYANPSIGYNPAYANQGTGYNAGYGSRYQVNPALNRPVTAFGSRTPNNPYNTPWLNAYSGQKTGLTNVYGAPGYRNPAYQYNIASAIPVTTVATPTAKYNPFGTQGYPMAYNPSSFGGTGYGYNSVGYGATGQGYNAKYSTGSKQWADGRYQGEYSSQSYAKPWYQNQFTSPTYAPTSTAYGK